LTFSGLVQPWYIVVLAFCLGIANAFDAPTRQSFVLEMVEREDLTNAIALNSTMFNTATAVGPAVAGLTYALVGPAWCFTLNGLSFIAVIIALLLMKLKPMSTAARNTSVVSDLKNGLRYVASHEIIRMLIGYLGIVSLFGFSIVTLIPAWAVEILGGDATTNGLLLSARGVGALAGALMIASLGRFRFKGRVLTLGSFVLPSVLLIFAPGTPSPPGVPSVPSGGPAHLVPGCLPVSPRCADRQPGETAEEGAPAPSRPGPGWRRNPGGGQSPASPADRTPVSAAPHTPGRCDPGRPSLDVSSARLPHRESPLTARRRGVPLAPPSAHTLCW